MNPRQSFKGEISPGSQADLPLGCLRHLEQTDAGWQQLLDRVVGGLLSGLAQDRLRSRVQADDPALGVKQQHACLQLLDHRLASQRYGIEQAEAEQDDGIHEELKRHPHQVEGQEGWDETEPVQQEDHAPNELSHQHERHRPAVLRGAPGQPAEDQQVDELQHP